MIRGWNTTVVGYESTKERIWGREFLECKVISLCVISLLISRYYFLSLSRNFFIYFVTFIISCNLTVKYFYTNPFPVWPRSHKYVLLISLPPSTPSEIFKVHLLRYSRSGTPSILPRRGQNPCGPSGHTDLCHSLFLSSLSSLVSSSIGSIPSERPGTLFFPKVVQVLY